MDLDPLPLNAHPSPHTRRNSPRRVEWRVVGSNVGPWTALRIVEGFPLALCRLVIRSKLRGMGDRTTERYPWRRLCYCGETVQDWPVSREEKTIGNVNPPADRLKQP